ncbi:MAG TPA: SRPBCC domain-containing protein [Ktedonobacteraceae bacterium]|nr:SRPBCC domain-containing protein [Ktedonobacteraceae bacterium]
MKLNGTHKFKANSTRVFNAILDPSVLKTCIPGCDSVEQLDASHLQLNITTSLPGLKGPYAVVVNLMQHQAPSLIVLGVKRQGRGGSVDATANINIADEAEGSTVTYDANAELGGPIAIANNPIGKGIVNSTLSSVFENLDKALA